MAKQCKHEFKLINTCVAWRFGLDAEGNPTKIQGVKLVGNCINCDKRGYGVFDLAHILTLFKPPIVYNGEPGYMEIKT